MSERPVLVPLNNTELAERAVPVGAEIARRRGQELRLVSFVEDPHEVRERQAYLEEVAGQVGALVDGQLVTCVVGVDPHAPQALAQLVAATDGDLVMATSGHVYLHDHYIGSAAETVVRTTGRAVLLVGAQCESMSVDRVVAPLDGSERSEQILPVAAAWADDLAVPLWLVSVVSEASSAAIAKAFGDGAPAGESNYLRRLARRAAELTSQRVEWETLHGADPAAAILAEAGDDALLVLSTHGRSGLARIALGSVATKVVRGSRRPVVVQRPEALDEG